MRWRNQFKKGRGALQGHGRRKTASGSRTEGEREKMMSREQNRWIESEIE